MVGDQFSFLDGRVLYCLNSSLFGWLTQIQTPRPPSSTLFNCPWTRRFPFLPFMFALVVVSQCEPLLLEVTLQPCVGLGSFQQPSGWDGWLNCGLECSVQIKHCNCVRVKYKQSIWFIVSKHRNCDLNVSFFNSSSLSGLCLPHTKIAATAVATFPVITSANPEYVHCYDKTFIQVAL